MRTIPLLFLLALAAAFFAACDGNSKVLRSAAVTPIDEKNAPVGRPSMIYVSDFDLGAATLKADPGLVETFRNARPHILGSALGRFRKSNDPAEELQYLSDLLADTVVKRLQEKGLPVTRIHGIEGLGKSGWLVAGAILQVDQGNRLVRAVLGFGAGESTEDLYVSLSDLAKTRETGFSDYNVTADSGKKPGGVVTLNPYAMAAKFVLERNASERDIIKAGDAIADRIIELANKQPK